MSRHRAFTYTHNNYQDTSLQDNLECSYIIYGKEVGESGTPHLQGFVYFSSAHTLSAAIKKLPGCHVEVAIAPQAAIQYCKKDGNFTERGIPPMSQKRKGQCNADRYEEARKLARQGNFDDIPADIYIRYRSTLHAIHAESRPEPATIQGDMQHEWIYGPAGCGKSSTARNENPAAYIKDLTKWWDNYDGQDAAIIDDVDKYDVQFARYLKLWCDRYPFQAEMKGKQQLIRPSKIVITSQYHPDEIWDDEKTKDALGRRLKIRRMGDEPEPVARCFKCNYME